MRLFSPTGALVTFLIIGIWVLIFALVSTRTHQKELEARVDYMMAKKRFPELQAGLRQLSRGRRKKSEGVPDGFVPITFDATTGKAVLCKLNFDEHHMHPSETPMFKDLIKKSDCKGSNTMVADIDELEKMGGVEIAGFIFHMSRCGSTLVADILSVDPENLVYSESAPPAYVIQHCNSCSREMKIKLLQIVMKAMGHSKIHSRMFFKFQSSNSPFISLLREAFPNVPWVFLYREPVEVLVSQFKSSLPNAKRPCTRVTEAWRQKRNVPSSADAHTVCGARLNEHLESALREAQADPRNSQVLNYAKLPDILWETIFPKLFFYAPSQPTVELMSQQSKIYSKSRNAKQQTFNGDSELKQKKATSEIHKAAEIMRTNFNHLEQLSSQGMARLSLRPNPIIVPESELAIPVDKYLPYPKLIPLLDVLKRWPPDEPDLPDIPGIAEGSLARFDYRDPAQRQRALLLRNHEVPFIVTNVPNVDDVVKKWTDEYLRVKFGNKKRTVLRSTSNHFMYWSQKLAGKQNFEPPTQPMQMNYDEFMAVRAKAETSPVESEHVYMQLNGGRENQFFDEDITIFKPVKSFWMVDPSKNRGINCRWGARGIIAEAHYDGGRNYIAMLKGAKRYIILPPKDCPNLYLYPRGHPQGRHSMVDWSKPIDLEKYPNFAKAEATEVYLRAGEVMYLPSYWFHYIISAGASIQCNSRSGLARRGRDLIADCGFY
eukprot:m.286608 g.286608  ORF g.286608 m.286608 type:complete len:716 (-) comp16352_c1_seq28:177-2324(-)